MYKVYKQTYRIDEDKPWVVLVHGAGGNASTWKRQIPALKPHFNILVFDLPGHGHSPSEDNAEPYDFVNIAKLIAGLMDDEQIEKAHFIGLSIGSLIIHQFYELYPKRVLKLIGSGGIYQITWKIHWFSKTAHFLARIFPYHFLYIVFAYFVMPKRNHALPRSIFIKSSKKLVRREYIRWLNLYGTFREAVKGIHFETQNVPVLVIMGSEDHIFLKPAMAFSSLYDNVVLHIIPKVGHICSIEAANEFNILVKDFLLSENAG